MRERPASRLVEGLSCPVELRDQPAMPRRAWAYLSAHSSTTGKSAVAQLWVPLLESVTNSSSSPSLPMLVFIIIFIHEHFLFSGPCTSVIWMHHKAAAHPSGGFQNRGVLSLFIYFKNTQSSFFRFKTLAQEYQGIRYPNVAQILSLLSRNYIFKNVK